MSDVISDRWFSVDEIAAACLFLVTDECGFMTGQTLHVNGGTDFF